eukprot:Amastigsp_a6480_7.p4 type:complete len:156 gc:universal Amastigsp_a6480_7:960-493(-)
MCSCAPCSRASAYTNAPLPAAANRTPFGSLTTVEKLSAVSESMQSSAFETPQNSPGAENHPLTLAGKSSGDCVQLAPSSDETMSTREENAPKTSSASENSTVSQNPIASALSGAFGSGVHDSPSADVAMSPPGPSCASAHPDDVLSATKVVAGAT